MDTVLWLCPSLPTETLKWLSSLPILTQKSFWWWQCSDRYIISLSPNLHTPFPLFSPSLISRTVSVDVKHHVYLLTGLALCPLCLHLSHECSVLMDELATEWMDAWKTQLSISRRVLYPLEWMKWTGEAGLNLQKTAKEELVKQSIIDE